MLLEGSQAFQRQPKKKEYNGFSFSMLAAR